MDTVIGKTRSMVDLLNNLGVTGSVLFVTQGSVTALVRSAHNIPKIWTLPVTQLNAQELLSRETLVMTLEAVRWAEESLASDQHGRRGINATGFGKSGAAPEPVQEPEEAEPAAEAESEGGEEQN